MYLKLTSVYFLLECFTHIYGAETFNCYVCSYTLSSDPKLDYECVNAPWNVTKGLPSVSCTTPYQCVTKVLLNQDKSQIRSVSRSCLPQDAICSGESCCKEDGVYPTCEHKCREEMCNNRNAEEYLKKGGSNGAEGLHFFLLSNFVAILTYKVAV